MVMRKIKRKKKKKIVILIVILILILIGVIITKILYDKKQQRIREKEKYTLIHNKYTKYVKVDKDSNIFQYTDGKMKKVGTIGKDVELVLGEIKDEYYEITNLDQKYYILYSNVEAIDMVKEEDNRYKEYIPFNQNVVTDNKTKIYNKDGELVLSLNKEFKSPIIIKEENYYGIIYSDRLYYVKKDEVKVEESKNTDASNTKGIPVLNYHFVNKDDDNTCDQIICISESNFRKHLDYIKNNNYLTITARELEMYIDGMIQLPPSVLITFDDGPYFYNARRILNEYKLHGTYFFVTVWMQDDLSEMESEYLELHSHTHDMHRVGKCPGGQGGGLKCLSEEFIQNDLKTSREKLHGSTYLAYPFYEYNDYSITQLKKAGFTMAFGGYNEGGNKYAKPGINKFKVPRLVIYNTTGVSSIKSYLSLK